MWRVFVIIGALMIASYVWAAGVTDTTNSQFVNGQRVASKHTLAWTANTTGVASGTIELIGKIHRVVTDPGANAPTADYDITLTDSYGIDVMSGVLSDRASTTTESVWAGGTTWNDNYVFVNDVMTLNVSNAGTSGDKNGEVIILLELP